LKHRAFFPAAIFIAILSSPLYSWEAAFFDIFDVSISTRAAALGGLHAALADDMTTLFSNPAGFRSVEPQFSVLEFTFSFYDAAIEIAGEVVSGVDNSTSDIRRGYLNVLGPIAVGYVGNGLGWGIFNTSNIRIYSWGASPLANEVLEENLVFIRGRTFRIPFPEQQSSLDLGYSLTGFLTVQGNSRTDIRQVFLPSVSPLELLTNGGPYRRAMGAGVEFGLLYSLKDVFSIGLAGRNLAFVQTRDFTSFMALIGGGASTASYSVLPMDLSLGILYRPPLDRLGRYINDIKVMVDYHNMLDFLIYPAGATHALLHIGLGIELQLLEIVSLRAGYYQLLPSVGLGLDFSFFTLNMAYFGREWTSEPGGYPVNSYAIGLEFEY
jgi:hypothetical protein